MNLKIRLRKFVKLFLIVLQGAAIYNVKVTPL